MNPEKVEELIGLAARFVRHLGGSYSNVVGLPLFEVAALLVGKGYEPAGRIERAR